MTTESSAKAMGSLADLLLDYVGTARTHDSNYDIASTLLANYGRLKQLSQREMAELCFVSQASLSRFSRFMGFESFAEFKDSLDGTNYLLADDYRKPFLATLMESDEASLEEYRQMLVASINATLTPENCRVAAEVLGALESAKRVVFFSHHFLWHIGRYFQGKMLLMARYVELYQAYDRQLEAAGSLGQGDLAIICSINGTYCSLYPEIARGIFDSGAKVAVLTQSTNSMFINRADYVLTCGTTNENDLGKYAALMTMDYLVMGYLKRYTQRSNAQ